jgi:hypothetical protein
MGAAWRPRSGSTCALASDHRVLGAVRPVQFFRAAWSRLETGFASAAGLSAAPREGGACGFSVDGSVPRMYQREGLGPL